MVIAVWILALVGLAFWSLVVWGIHVVLAIDPHWVGSLSPQLETMPYAAWLTQWFPGWQELARIGLETTQSALGWVGGAAPVALVIIWAIGAFMLLGVAIVLTIVIKLLRANSAPARPAA